MSPLALPKEREVSPVEVEGARPVKTTKLGFRLLWHFQHISHQIEVYSPLRRLLRRDRDSTVSVECEHLEPAKSLGRGVNDFSGSWRFVNAGARELLLVSSLGRRSSRLG